MAVALPEVLIHYNEESCTAPGIDCRIFPAVKFEKNYWQNVAFVTCDPFPRHGIIELIEAVHVSSRARVRRECNAAI